MAGFLPPTPWSRQAILAKLAVLIDGSASQFARLVPDRRGKGFRQSVLPSVNLPPWMIETRLTKYCPQCLRERALIPAVWDLAIWTCCPHHECQMVRNCPGCQSPVTWRRGKVDRCVDSNCAVQLSSAISEPAPAKELDLVLLVAETLGIHGLPKRSSLWPIFGHLGAADVIRMIGGLGLAAAGRPRRSGGNPLTSEVMESAAEILSDWPHSFHSFLTKVADKQEGALSLKRRFGLLYQRLLGQGAYGSLMPERARAIVLQEFIAHVDESWIGEAAVPRGLLGDVRHGQWMNREQAARRLNIHENTVTKMAHDRQIASRWVKAGAKTYLFISTDDVERLASSNFSSLDREEFKKHVNALSLNEAAQLAGVSTNHVRRLIESGYVETIVRFTSVYVLRNSLEKLITNIERLARPNCDEAAYLINVACSLQGRKNSDIGAFLKSVLDGKITPVRIDTRERGLRRFLFDGLEVANLARQLNF